MVGQKNYQRLLKSKIWDGRLDIKEKNGAYVQKI